MTSDAGDIVAVKQSARSGGAVTLQVEGETDQYAYSLSLACADNSVASASASFVVLFTPSPTATIAPSANPTTPRPTARPSTLQPSTNAPTAPLRPFDIRETKRRSAWGDRFGETVALIDARLVAAGAWGYAYVHNSSDGGLTWAQERVMDGSPWAETGLGDRPWPGFDESFFGCAVALAPAVDGSGDADLVVGTCGNEDTGAADVEEAEKIAQAERVVKSLRDSAKRDRAANRRSRTSKTSKKKACVSKDGAAPAGAAPAGAAPAGAADADDADDFHCGACALRDTPLMIQCEDCDSWFHFGCVDLTSETVPDGAFFCGRCAAARAEEASASAALVALAVPTLDAPAAPHVLDADHPLVAKLGGFFSNAASAPVEKRKRDDALRGLKKVPDLHRDLTLVLTSQNQHYRSLRVCFQSSVVDVVFRLLAFTLTDEFFEEDNKVACAMAWLAELVETVHDPKTRRFLTAKRDIICRIVGRLGNRLLDCGFTVQEARREVVATKRSRSHAEMKAMVFGLFFFCVQYYHEPDRPFEMIMLISRAPCSHACAAGDARGCDRFLKAIRADPLKIAASRAPRSVRPAGVRPGGYFDGVFAWISKLRA